MPPGDKKDFHSESWKLEEANLDNTKMQRAGRSECFCLPRGYQNSDLPIAGTLGPGLMADDSMHSLHTPDRHVKIHKLHGSCGL